MAIRLQRAEGAMIIDDTSSHLQDFQGGSARGELVLHLLKDGLKRQESMLTCTSAGAHR